MSQSYLFISNAATIWVTRILLVLPQLVLVPYLIKTIGEEGYGVYALVWSLILSIEQLQRSMQSGVVKYSAGFIAQNRTDEINSIISSSFVYSLILAILACAGMILASTYYSTNSNQIGTALVIAGIMAFFVYPLTPYVAVIQACQRYYVNAISITVTRYIGLLVVITWFSMLGPSVNYLIIIMAAMLFLARFAQVPIAYRLVPGLKNSFRFFNLKSFRMISVFGAVMVFASLCLVINTTGVRWLMGALVSTSFVTQLVIVLMPGSVLSQIIDAMTVTVMPATSAYEATGNQTMLQELLVRGIRYTTILSLAVLLAAVLLMQNVLSVWIGSDYMFLSPYALILFASQAFMLSTSIGHHMLKGMGKLMTVVSIYAFSLVVVPIGTILAVFLVGNNPHIAVVTGLGAGYLICGYLQIVFCARAVNAHIPNILFRSYAQPFVIALVIGSFAFVLVTIVDIDGLFGRVVVSSLSVMLFAIGCYRFIATTAERKIARSILIIALRKISALFRFNPYYQK